MINICIFQTKISFVHDAVSRGSLAETQKLVSEEPKKKLAIAKDPAGTPLLHKAVYHDHQDIVEWLAHNFPIAVQQKDKVIFIIRSFYSQLSSSLLSFFFFFLLELPCMKFSSIVLFIFVLLFSVDLKWIYRISFSYRTSVVVIQLVIVCHLNLLESTFHLFSTHLDLGIGAVYEYERRKKNCVKIK